MGARSSKSRLCKEDLEFLKEKTRYDESTITEWYKGFIQDCPDGLLTQGAFMKIYSKCFPTGNAKEFCDHVFRTFDRDKNNFIDFKEFLLAIDVTSGGSPKEKLQWAFRMYDVDGNGVIDLQEMVKIVASIYKMMGDEQVVALEEGGPEERASAIFKKMDSNADGKVEMEEFIRCCLEDSRLIDLLTPSPDP